MSFKKITEVFPPQEAGTSSLRMTVVGGPAVNVWSAPGTLTEGDAQTELKVQLQPSNPVVIGRQQGGQIEYLDPQYQPTPIMPDSSSCILNSSEKDREVSRGHFMLKGSPIGIYLVNGVPRQEGGIRPPLNGTILLEPVQRWMQKGEEYLIERGSSAKIRLPNGTVILLIPDNE